MGSAAIQLGKAVGARVIATAGGPDKVKVCLDLGADVAIDYSADDFVDVVKAETNGNGADVIYDPVGGDVFDKSRKCIAYNGRLLVIGFTSGRFPEAPANHILIKNYSVIGVHWGLSRRKEPHLLREIHADLTRLADEGLVKPLVGETVAFDGDVPRALEALASRKTVGKIVVTRLTPATNSSHASSPDVRGRTLHRRGLRADHRPRLPGPDDCDLSAARFREAALASRPASRDAGCRRPTSPAPNCMRSPSSSASSTTPTSA